MDRKPCIVGIGETLWDVFPEQECFGGAPANFCCAAAEMANKSADIAIITAVGDDEHGRRARAEFERHGVTTLAVQTNDLPTGRVYVTLDEVGRPEYRFETPSAWDALVWTDALEALAARANVVCFGTLGQRAEASRGVIEKFLKSLREDAIILLDINLRPPYVSQEVIDSSLAFAHVLKLNDDELATLTADLGLKGSLQQQLAALVERFQYKLIALTMGAKGSVLYSPGTLHELPNEPVDVVDTVGAGDAFAAAMALGLVHNEPLPLIHEYAGRAARYVCTQAGATPTFFPFTLPWNANP